MNTETLKFIQVDGTELHVINGQVRVTTEKTKLPRFILEELRVQGRVLMNTEQFAELMKEEVV
jgi:hypothetical protein